jgi:hypothetical protein
MKQKVRTEVIQGRYTLDEISLEEVTLAFKHHLNLNPFPYVEKWYIEMHERDAWLLANSVSGLILRILAGRDVRELQITIGANLGRGEIQFV